MSEPDALGPNDVDELLEFDCVAAIGDGLRLSLLKRTTGMVRRRRRARRVGLVAALLACYLAGMATTQTWRSVGRGPDRSIAGNDNASASQTPPAGASNAVDVRPLPKATAAPERSRFEVLRGVSDRCLRQRDVSLALRYSVSALEHASDEERAISPEDNWIVMALKQSRIEETNHELDGG